MEGSDKVIGLIKPVLKKQKVRWILVLSSAFFFFIYSVRTLAHGIVSPVFVVGLSPLVIPILGISNWYA